MKDIFCTAYYFLFLLCVSMPIHAECNIVLPILSVCLSNAGNVSKRIDISSQFFDSLVGTFCFFLFPLLLQNYKGAVNTRMAGKLLQIYLIMLETIRDRAIVTMEH